MAAPVRRITATISLEETTDDSRSYPTYRELVETKITITLPVPNEGELPYYLSQQIAGFLSIATESAPETNQPQDSSIDDTAPGDDDNSEEPDASAFPA